MNQPTRNRLYPIGWLLVAGITWGSLTTSPIQSAAEINDKLQHFGAYFITMAWFGNFLARNTTRYLHAGFLASLAAVLELLQPPLAQRTFDELDIIVSTAGALFALYMFHD